MQIDSYQYVYRICIVNHVIDALCTVHIMCMDLCATTKIDEYTGSKYRNKEYLNINHNIYIISIHITNKLR